MPTAEDVRKIARTLPFYKNVAAGKVDSQCVNFSRDLCNALRDANIPAIMVGGDANMRVYEHCYLLVRFDEGIRIVDPTAGQYFEKLKGDIYIGTREELITMGRQSLPQEPSDRIWSEKPYLWKKEGEFELVRDKFRFKKEWGDTGVVIAPTRVAER